MYVQAFFLEALPDDARDKIFEKLTYDTAAVACCVSRAWNRTFATHARHLWARLLFDARHLDVPITDEVVRGVAAKARDALTSITFPDDTTVLYGRRGHAGGASALVLSLCATQPTLAHVGLPDADASAVRDILEASSGLAVLQVGRLFLDPAEVTSGEALMVLTHPALRVRHLHVVPRRQQAQWGDPDVLNAIPARALAAAAAAMQAQAAWLEAVTLAPTANEPAYSDHDAAGLARATLEQDETAAFVAAVAACGRLAEVHARGVFRGDAYAAVVAALAAHDGCDSATVEPVDAALYLPALLKHLGPRLVRLSITGQGVFSLTHVMAYQTALGVLARSLHDAPALRHLAITLSTDYHTVNADGLFVALAASESVTHLELHRPTCEQMTALADAGLPSSLTSLSVHGAVAMPTEQETLATALRALLYKAEHVRSLSFSNCTWGRREFWALADHLVGNKQLLRLTLTDISTGPLFDTWAPLANSLWLNTTLEELTVSPVPDATAGALSDGIRRAGALRRLTLGVALASGAAHNFGTGWINCAGVEALADGFRHNRTLRSLRVVAHRVLRVHDLYVLRAYLRDQRDRRAARGRGAPEDEVTVAWAGASQAA